MQELEFVPADSDEASLVLRLPGVTGEDALFRLPVTRELTDLLTAPDAAGTTGPAGTDVPVRLTTNGAPAVLHAVGSGTAGAPGRGPSLPGTSPATGDGAAGEQRDGKKDERKKVRLRPREIQKRLRHGATVAELAEETGASETRLLPYAHPIEMERHRIAELARNAYPVRTDGPADHTLWEILATSFGARGEDVRAAEWSAAMDSSDTWIVTVTWTRGNRQGATRFVAEFRWTPAPSPGTGPSTVEPANAVATDLIDPRFTRPVRSVSRTDDTVDRTSDLTGTPVAAGRTGDTPVDDTGEVPPAPGRAGDDGGTDVPEDTVDDTSGTADGGHGSRGVSASRTGSTTDIFGDPTPDSHPARRKRSTATPHWEDVLLGVRTTPRRKK